eukprot:883697-Alexandrium_andersonii.AAC.1
MSASLVGSEMCIRDSHWRGHMASVRTSGEVQRGPLHGPRRWLRWPRTVSYTHLTLPTICSV